MHDVVSKLQAGRGDKKEAIHRADDTFHPHMERYGKPVAFYSDKDGVFRVNKKDAIGGDGMTQFGRALHALNIDIICANSSQAEGRVERANSALQDRLVKEMRLSGINTIEAGNAFLPAFMEQYNARFAKARFAKPPFDDRDVHRGPYLIA